MEKFRYILYVYFEFLLHFPLNFLDRKIKKLEFQKNLYPSFILTMEILMLLDRVFNSDESEPEPKPVSTSPVLWRARI